MKVAIEFYGHLRSFRKAAHDIKKYLINQFDEDPDIFIHTWDKTDHSNIIWHNESGESRGCEVDESDLKFLEKTYNPKKLLVEPQKSLKDDKKFIMLMTDNEAPLSMIKNVFYTKWRANELRKEYQKEQGVEYDFVIQARLDLYFNKPFKLDKFIKYKTIIKKNPINIDISNKFFYCSDRWINHHGSDDLVYAGGSDVIYFGTPQVIDKAVSLYQKIENYDLSKIYYSNEYLMLHNAIKNGLEPVRVCFEKDIDFGVLRTEECLEYLDKIRSNKPKLRKISKVKREIIRILNQILSTKNKLN